MTTLPNDQIKRCFECGHPASHEHHVIPRSLGGTKTVPLCSFCHPKAHGKHGYWGVSELAQKRVQRMRANRQWTGGVPPYGYRIDANRRLVRVDSEWHVLKMVLAKFMLGMSAYKIATQLNELGTPTKNGAPKWTRCVVKQIVRRRRKQQWRAKRTRAPF